MRSVADLREDLATLKRNGQVTGPTALFLASMIDRIEALEQPRSAIRPGFFPQPETGDFPNATQAEAMREILDEQLSRTRPIRTEGAKV